MNDEIRHLMREAGLTGELGWRDVIVLYNYAPIPPPLPNARTNVAQWNRGFNLVVLSHGQPEYFVKCRPMGDPVLAWESEVRTAIAGDRPGGVSIASVRVASSDRLTVQVCAFHRGSHYGKLVSRLSTDEYVASMRSVLTGTTEIANLALERCPRVRNSAKSISLMTAAMQHIDALSAVMTLDDDERTALVQTLERAGDVPPRPQHGDFWWQNLIVVDGQLWTIDFDSYGDIQVPLFDDMTLILTTLSLRAGGGTEGLDRLLSDTAEGAACRRLLAERAKTEGVAVSQLTAVLIHYLAQMAATVHRRGGFKFSASHLATFRRGAERLAAGVRLVVPD